MKLNARRSFLLALLATMVVVGCQSFPYLVGLNPGPAKQDAPPVSQLDPPDATYASQWEAGRALYVGDCVQCHKPKPIQDFAIDQWKGKIIPRMSGKAKLTPEQTQSLTDYIMAVKRSQLIGNEKPRPVTSPISAADNR